MFKRNWLLLVIVTLVALGAAACTSVGPAQDGAVEPSAAGEVGSIVSAPDPASSGPATGPDVALAPGEIPVAVARESADTVQSSPLAPGYGGGGGFYGGPFVDADITLNAPLPNVSEAAVYMVPDAATMQAVSPDELKAFAAKFGVEGPVYFEWYPGLPLDAARAPAEGAPLSYHLFGPDRVRVMAFSNGELLYENAAIYQPDGEFDDQPLPFEERAALAERFAAERGLLDFEYDLHPGWGHEVHFLPLVDGYPVTWARLIVQVMPSGTVGSVTYRPYTEMTVLEQGALRSAEAAYAYLQDHLDGNVAFHLYPTDPFYHAQDVPEGTRTHWQREMAPGTSVSMISWLQVFRPVEDEGTPRIVSDRNIIIDADAATLEELIDASTQGGSMRLNGVVGGVPGNLTLALESWELLNVPSELYLNGTSRIVDDQVFFEFPGGFRAQLVNPPADLPADTGISVYSWGLRTGEDGVTALLDWVNIDRMTPYMQPSVEPIEVDPYSGITNLLVDDVSLVYWHLYPYDIMPLTTAPYRENENAHLVPMWRFSGETNKGDVIDIFVPALASAELAE